MSNPRLTVLKDEFTLKRSELDALDTLAANEGRDLTDQERVDYEANVTRMEALEAEIETTLKRQERFDKVAASTATVLGTSAARTNPRSPVTGSLIVPTRGEQLLTRAKASLGQLGVARFRGDVDEAETLQRVVAHGVAGDGTAPTTIEGDLIKFVDANRYAVNVSRRLPMPDNHAPNFKRPRVTQRTTVAQQVTEGDVLSSQRLQLTGDTVTKGVYGGTLTLSEQEIDWTDPALLDLAVQDLAESYAIATDTVLTAAIEAAVDEATETVCSLTAASDVFIKAIGTASSTVYSRAKRLPDTLFVAPDRWAYLVGLTDGDGRPMFPISNGFNLAGQNIGGVTGFTGFNILGLNVVVDPNFSSNIWIVAVSQLCEVYEQNKGLLTIAAPSTLETNIAYRGYFAANVYANGINALEAA